MKENQDYKNEGLAALKGHWPQAVLATLVVALLGCVCTLPYIIWAVKTAAIGSDPTDLQAALAYMGGMYRNLFVSYALIFLIAGPLVVGLVNAFKELLFSQDGKILSNSFRIGYGSYWRHMWGFLLKNIFIFLWSLLFVIPGIIKQLSYAMTNTSSSIILNFPPIRPSTGAGHDVRPQVRPVLSVPEFRWLVPAEHIDTGNRNTLVLSVRGSRAGVFYRDVRDDYERRMNAAPAQPLRPPRNLRSPDGFRTENPEDYMPKSE